MASSSTLVSEFDKSIEELLYFGDCLQLHEKHVKQQHVKELDQQTHEFNVQLQNEKKRIEQLQQSDRTLTEQIEQMIEKQIDLNGKYTTLNTKYMCCLEEANGFKTKCHEKNLQIDQLQKQVLIFKNDHVKLQSEHQNLLDKITETPSHTIPDNNNQLVEKVTVENEELKKSLTERDSEIVQLNEQLDKVAKEIEERLVQRLAKLKNDFEMMFDKQSTFFLEKIALLKEKQQRNIARLYQH